MPQTIAIDEPSSATASVSHALEPPVQERIHKKSSGEQSIYPADDFVYYDICSPFLAEFAISSLDDVNHCTVYGCKLQIWIVGHICCDGPS